MLAECPGYWILNPASCCLHTGCIVRLAVAFSSNFSCNSFPWQLSQVSVSVAITWRTWSGQQQRDVELSWVAGGQRLVCLFVFATAAVAVTLLILSLVDFFFSCLPRFTILQYFLLSLFCWLCAFYLRSAVVCWIPTAIMWIFTVHSIKHFPQNSGSSSWPAAFCWADPGAPGSQFPRYAVSGQAQSQTASGK